MIEKGGDYEQQLRRGLRTSAQPRAGREGVSRVIWKDKGEAGGRGEKSGQVRGQQVGNGDSMFGDPQVVRTARR